MSHIKTTAQQRTMEQRIATGLKRRREHLGLSVNDLAARAGVSRAMISKVERLEASPTAVLLGKLCGGLEMTLSSLIASAEAPPRPPVLKAIDQPVWRDPKTGLRRTMITAAHGARVEIVRIDLPGHREVTYPPPRSPYEQQILMLQGLLSVQLGAEHFVLGSGDSMHMHLDRALTFANKHSRACRYLVVVENPS